MKLARSDDFDESAALLLYQASKDYPDNGIIWISGEKSGQCSVLYASSSSNYSITTKPCTDSYVAYCEYDRACFCFFVCRRFFTINFRI